MKRFELTFAFLQLPLDYLLLVLAGFTAYSLRFAEFITRIRPVYFKFNLPWHTYWPLVLIVATAWIIIFALNGLYHTNPNRKLTKDLNLIFFACSTGFAGIALYTFFTLQKFDSRFLVLASWILAILYISFGRIFMKLAKMILYRLGLGLRRVVIIGQNHIGEEISNFLQNNKRLGYKLVNQFAVFNDSVAEKIKHSKIDEIIFTDSKATEEQALQAINFANDHHLAFKYSADLFSTISTSMTVTTLAGVPIIELRRTRLMGWGKIVKRLFDIFGSILLIIITSPLMILTALCTLIETGWPIIYKNERVGQNGHKFFTYKFRSLYKKYCTGRQFGEAGDKALHVEAELIEKQNSKDGPVYKIKDDPRITPFGRFIRKWSIDELPQFFNVLKGEMSLVGPRPHQPREVEKYQRHHRTVLAIKPGITGMAQISGRSNLNFEEEVRLDTFYLEHWNLLLDIIILLKTPFAVIKSKGAW